MARAAEQLAAALNGFNETASGFYASWVTEMAEQARRGIAEGDLRNDLDPDVVSQSIVSAMFGTRLVSNAMSGQDGDGALVSGRLSQTWELLLPGLVSEASLGYFRQFLKRETIRHARAPHNDSEVEQETAG
jgi:hypothetical protein